MKIDRTIEQAMHFADIVAENVLDWRTNAEAIEASENLLDVLKIQRDLLVGNGNIVTLRK